MKSNCISFKVKENYKNDNQMKQFKTAIYC